MKAVVLAFANQKGGVGKTTSAVNIAASLGVRGHKTLLVDLDPQGNATSGVGINKKSLKKTVYEALVASEPPEKLIIKTEYENLDVIPATISLAGAEVELYDSDSRENALKTAIDKLRDSYEYVIIDCPPSLGMLTINGLTAADGVVIPMQCEYYALEGLTQLMLTIKRIKKLYNHDLGICGILITMYNGRLNLSAQVLDELKKYYSDKLFSTTVPRNVRLTEAPGFGQPVYYLDKYSKGSEAYLAIADEIVRRIYC